MDEIDLDLGFIYDQQHREERYIKHNAARRKLRLDAKELCFHSSSTIECTSFIVQPHNPSITEDDRTLHNDHQLADKTKTYLIEHIPSVTRKTNDYEMFALSNDICDGEEETPSHEDTSPVKLPLHNYTMNSTSDYCERFTIVARQANLSKRSTNEFLSLIKAGLPIPNNLPSTEEALLLLLGVEDLFTKRSICLLCYGELNVAENICLRCHSTDKKSIAHM
jgi:hypothetical protein